MEQILKHMSEYNADSESREIGEKETPKRVKHTKGASVGRGN
jgi:hypothetical protein